MLRRMQIASVITVSAPPSARPLPFCTTSNYAGLQQRNYPLCLTFTLTWPDGLHNFIEGTLDKAKLYENEIRVNGRNNVMRAFTKLKKG